MLTPLESDNTPVGPTQSPHEAEQSLCNEAMKTGEFDKISDREWINMCERVASQHRKRKPITPSLLDGDQNTMPKE